MKKILIMALFIITIQSVKAQNVIYDDVFFTNLYAKWTQGNTQEQANYKISNTLNGFGGDWGLDIKWFGGVKMRAAFGVLYLNRWGNIGINTENPTSTLDINGDIKSTGNIATSDIISGGINSWIFHTPDDQRRALHIAPGLGNGQFDWTKQTVFNNNGNIAVNGKLEATEVKVTQSPTADFVFEETYDLPKLEDVEKHIKDKKHLPEIASAKEMEKEGVNIGEFQIKLLQKIEELTLYTIEQNKKIKQLEQENQQIKTLMERLDKLEKNAQ